MEYFKLFGYTLVVGVIFILTAHGFCDVFDINYKDIDEDMETLIPIASIGIAYWLTYRDNS